MFWNRKKQNDNGIEFVIAGLGNPGREYETTRHNMGFMVIDILADKTGIDVKKLKHKALYGTGTIDGHKVMLVKPQTYMNLSGESIREIMRYYKVPVENLLVIYDDIDIEAGTLRIRKKGSAGTHNGMKSIIYQLGSDEFPRIRVGIGDKRKGDLKDYVIGSLGKKEAEELAPVLNTCADACCCFVQKGIDRAMNEHNSRNKKVGEDKNDH